jgi:tetratricopeptide (TPR) repeat protein
VKREGSYRLLRVRTVDGAPRPLFRVVTEGGSNYHEYELVPDRAGEGRARIVDVYVFNSGEPLSATLRRLFVRGASEEPGFLGRLAGKKPGGPFTEHLEEIKRMNQARAKGDAAGWMAIYRALPDELQQDRSFLLMRVAMASRLGEAEYEAAAAALLAQAPDDPALSLVQIDGLFFQKKYAKALKVVERLDARLGGDPFLDALAANLLLEQGKPAAAKQRAERAVRAEPDLITGWWALVNVSLRTRDFDETARLLLHIERALHVPIGDLSDLDAYHGFVASEAYRAWQESRSVE